MGLLENPPTPLEGRGIVFRGLRRESTMSDEVDKLTSKIRKLQREKRAMKKAEASVLTAVLDANKHESIDHTHREYTDKCAGCQVIKVVVEYLYGEGTPRPHGI
jgi:hypothetical protein